MDDTQWYTVSENEPYIYMKLSELLVLDSWYAIEKFHDFISHHHYPWLFHDFPCQDVFPGFSVTLGTLHEYHKGRENHRKAVYRASFNPNLQCFPPIKHMLVAFMWRWLQYDTFFIFGESPYANCSRSRQFRHCLNKSLAHGQFSKVMSCAIFNIIQPYFFGLILRLHRGVWFSRGCRVLILSI